MPQIIVGATLQPQNTLVDWAELFLLCAQSQETGDTTPILNWLRTHAESTNLPEPEETNQWSDSAYIAKEAVMFLDKFAENWISDLNSRQLMEWS